jgi:hypothetical protein
VLPGAARGYWGDVDEGGAIKSANGQVAEWFKAAVLKTAVGSRPPWVRIPPCPPVPIDKIVELLVFSPCSHERFPLRLALSGYSHSAFAPKAVKLARLHMSRGLVLHFPKSNAPTNPPRELRDGAASLHNIRTSAIADP